MRTLRALSVRLLGLFRKRQSEEDFAAELESHVALHTEDGIRAGLPPRKHDGWHLSDSVEQSRRGRLIANAARYPGSMLCCRICTMVYARCAEARASA